MKILYCSSDLCSLTSPNFTHALTPNALTIDLEFSKKLGRILKFETVGIHLLRVKKFQLIKFNVCGSLVCHIWTRLLQTWKCPEVTGESFSLL